MLPDVLVQLPGEETLKSLTGYGAYDTQPVHEAMIECGAIPTQKCSNPQGSCFWVSQCGDCSVQAAGAKSLEALDWLPPEKLGGNQDELHQATGRASDVSHF